MTSTILSALLLGTFAGAAPGPYTTMVAGTALEKGFRAGVRLALVPMVTDVLPLLLTALLLERLSWTALTLLGITGGVLVSVIGVRFLRRHTGPLDLSELGHGQSVSFMHAALSVILSPAPWIFWLVVASPLLLRSWGRSWVEGVVYLVVLFSTNIGTATALAWAASHGRRVLSVDWRRRVLRVVGSGLIVAGAILVWQSMAGNFQALIDQQRSVRSAVEEQTRPDPDGSR